MIVRAAPRGILVCKLSQVKTKSHQTQQFYLTQPHMDNVVNILFQKKSNSFFRDRLDHSSINYS